MDVEIVGGGFAGLATAQACAARGLETVVWERTPEPGAAVHTTGLLVKEVADEHDLPLGATRKIRGVRLYAPSMRWIDLETPGYFFLATDTAAVLRTMAGRAEDAGAEIRFGREHPGRGEARILVGADGPRSRIARQHGLGRNRTFLAGVEAQLVGVEGLPDRLHVFLDSERAPGYIGWIVPGVGITQVGLAARRPFRPDLDGFLAHVSHAVDLGCGHEIGRRGGPIPVGGTVRPFASNHVVLVGDAAGLVSPLTAGGIHMALRSGRAAGVAIASHLLDGGPPLGTALESVYPRFTAKRLLRAAFDLQPPNRLLDLVIGTPILRALAQTVFFHHRGLLSGEAWRDLAASARRP